MRIAVVGHLCLDIIPSWRRGGLDALKPGTIVEMDGLSFSTGGVVANTGLCLKRLGFDPILIARVGSDHLANIIRNIFEQQGVSAGYLHRSEGTTSYTIVLSPPGTDRVFLHYPGCNHEFSLEDIDFGAVEASFFHFGYPPLMRQMYINNGEHLAAVFQRAKEAGCITSLDMAVPDPNAPAGQVDWKKILARTLPFVDIFLPSLDELLFMVSREHYAALQAGRLQLSTALLDELGRSLLDLGSALVGIKLGSQGFYVCSSSRAAALLGEQWRSRQLHSPVFQVTARGTTGAGDTTIAGFLAGLACGKAPEDAVTLATAVGAYTVESASVVEGVPLLAEVERRINQGWARGQVTMAAAGWRPHGTGVLLGPQDGAFHR
ncbi:MAG TPA: carbohydrate kinase family protein [Limnochordia bacterium]|nr:carbohydrate kinase family protein [Limnochordia bacterium]